MVFIRKIIPVGRTLTRRLATDSCGTPPVPARIRRLKENQKKFGIDDGTPVHLKRGLSDKLLYSATVGVTLFGLGWTLQTFWRLINK